MSCPMCGVLLQKDAKEFIHCEPCDWHGNETVRLKPPAKVVAPEPPVKVELEEPLFPKIKEKKGK